MIFKATLFQTVLGKTSKTKNRNYNDFGLVWLSDYLPHPDGDQELSDNFSKRPDPPTVVVTKCRGFSYAS